jgi:hypothetical protein
MKKEMLFGVALLCSGIALAEVPELDFDAVDPDQVDAITYAFTVFRDETYDKASWADLVSLGTQVAKCTVVSKAGNISTDELVKSTLEACKQSYACTNKEGIHGEVNIWLNDEPLDNEDATKGCDGICGGDDPKDR